MNFSPLALTQALPFLPLAQGDIDYETERRSQPGVVDATLREPAAKVILTRGGLLAVPRGQGELVDRQAVAMRLATLPGAYVADELATHPHAVAMVLGSYGGARRERVVAVDLTRLGEAGDAPRLAGTTDSGTVDGAMGAAGQPGSPTDPGVGRVPDSADQGADDAFDESVGTASPQRGKPSLLDQAAERFDWVDLRGFAPHASAREAGQATTAVCLSIWHTRQRHCPTCGAPTEAAMAGWAQRCTSAADGNRLLFPRVEPAVITAIVDSQDRLLLQHNAAWNDPTLYSVSAGFVEAGENLEHACRREAMEEVGVRLGEVRYLGSQPWPYPASLMVAFKAQALGTTVRVDGVETRCAEWMTRDEYTAAVVSGRVSAPGKATIARYMIEEWLGREL
ncbi:NAD(+) diphosphatase [Bifidobacterium pullorum subsp. saeculare]|uniref:NAD(+) diphosphatase n=1 Tax=Bifidobacterium pullorum subsp. saeculare TaxID=78257 RepID=A0A939B880_9BIFI|nr:NAD(+) diphosphatase [Bifidobacterium pullorum]MBM6699617.1 NAD(+) diphosphatase [Bifidobacterium pullorum subsp. saeculare]